MDSITRVFGSPGIKAQRLRRLDAPAPRAASQAGSRRH